MKFRKPKKGDKITILGSGPWIHKYTDDEKYVPCPPKNCPICEFETEQEYVKIFLQYSEMCPQITYNRN